MDSISLLNTISRLIVDINDAANVRPSSDRGGSQRNLWATGMQWIRS